MTRERRSCVLVRSRPRRARSGRSAAAIALLVLAAPAGAQVWEAAPAFPGAARTEALGIAQGDVVRAVAGLPFAPPDDPAAQVQALFPGASAWTLEAPLEGPLVRVGGGIDALGRIVLFGGVDGLDPEGDEGQVVIYDPLDGPQGGVAQRSDLAPADGFAWASDGAARLYSIGGGPGAGASTAEPNSTRVERYDANLDAWQVLAPLPAGRADAAAASDGAGGVLLIGGWTQHGGQRSAKVYRYDVAGDAWSDAAAPDLAVALSGARAALGQDGRVYVVGGEDASGPLRTTWVLSPGAAEWVAGPELQVARSRPALALRDDGYVYAMGGDDGAGGTATVERLFTPACPAIVAAPESGAVWSGQALELSVAATGGAPLAYQWRKDGLPLTDGAAPGGGTLTGATTDALRIQPAAPADAGRYDVVVSNGCGSIESAGALVEVRTPPLLGQGFVTVVHPPDALHSSVRGVHRTTLVGTTTHPSPHPLLETATHPALWPAPGRPRFDLLPSESVQGEASAVAGILTVGSFYWPHWTPQGTEYDRHACAWLGTSFHHVQPSGWEFGGVNDTDGSAGVGTLTWNESSTNADGAYWPDATSSYAVILTPSGAWGSACNAIDAGRQFGSVHLGYGVVHAAMWSGAAASFIDLNPAGASRSFVLGAGGGQQVGRADFAGVPRAVLWGGSAADVVELAPPGASASEAVDCDGGLQVGSATFASGSKPVLWRGAAAGWLDLSQLLPPHLSGAAARAIAVDDPLGTVMVGGDAWEAAAGRRVGVVWRWNLLQGARPTTK